MCTTPDADSVFSGAEDAKRSYSPATLWVCLSFVQATALFFVGVRIMQCLLNVYGSFLGFAVLALFLAGVCVGLKNHVGSSSS